MNRGMWKRDIRRGTAIVLSLVMCLSTAACGAVRGNLEGQSRQALAGAASGNGAPVHSSIPYSQRPYEHYDPAFMEQALADFERACAVKGQDEEVVRLYNVIVDEFDRLSDQVYMAQLRYDRDVSDEAAAAEQAYTTKLYSELGDKTMACLKKGMDSSYKELLTEQMGSEFAPYAIYYEEKPEELTELNGKEQELLREYDRLAVREVTVELEDGQWSYSRLEQDTDLSSERYSQIEDALVREKNRVLGSNFVELARVRRQIAEYKGYDDYAEYSFEAVYGRDYSLQDAKQLCSDVRSWVVPLNNDIWNKNVSQESYDYLDSLEESSTEDILDTVGPAVMSVNSELGDIFRYLRENGLYDIQSEEEEQDRTDGSYTVGFPGYKDAFIFINRSHTFMDYQSLIHEFGHFSAYYYNTTPELFQGFSVDVSEVQSQGLEVLADRYAASMFGQGAEAYEFESITDLLYVTIMACMLQEFEEAVYMEPDMSLDDMNRKFKEIQDSYGGWFYDVYDRDKCYGWVDIPHLFYSPLYYMGYGTSALSALDLWTMSQNDWDGAVNTYMGILKEGLNSSYRDTMYRSGLRDIFDSRELLTLTGEVRRLQELEAAGEEEDSVTVQEDQTVRTSNTGTDRGMIDFLVLGGIGMIIVFQVMILGTGFVIIWLLVKKRRDE